MKVKSWELNIVDNPNMIAATENDIFYSTDTEAFLKFDLLDTTIQPSEAMLTLSNRGDGSIVHEKVDVIDNKIEWEMREEIIVHSGAWQVQLVYTFIKSGVDENYTSPVVSFNVESHLMDERQPTLVAIENWNTFVGEANILVTEWQDYIIDLKQRVDSGEFKGEAGDVAFEEFTPEQIETLRGPKGDKGDNLEFNWNGTQLGVRVEGQTSYQYVNLKGDKGDSGSIDNLNITDIEDALGFTPISADDVQEGLILGEGPIEKGWLFKPVIIADERNE